MGGGLLTGGGCLCCGLRRGVLRLLSQRSGVTVGVLAHRLGLRGRRLDDTLRLGPGCFQAPRLLLFEGRPASRQLHLVGREHLRGLPVCLVEAGL